MEQTKNIAYQPTDGLSYDPSEAKYWDPEALGKEIRRTFEICHGCRLCFKYCDSFPSLFSSIDGKDGDVRQITAAQTAKVMDSCFQCKLCEVQCPYSERESRYRQRGQSRPPASNLPGEGSRHSSRQVASRVCRHDLRAMGFARRKNKTGGRRRSRPVSNMLCAKQRTGDRPRYHRGA